MTIVRFNFYWQHGLECECLSFALIIIIPSVNILNMYNVKDYSEVQLIYGKSHKIDLWTMIFLCIVTCSTPHRCIRSGDILGRQDLSLFVNTRVTSPASLSGLIGAPGFSISTDLLLDFVLHLPWN